MEWASHTAAFGSLLGNDWLGAGTSSGHHHILGLWDEGDALGVSKKILWCTSDVGHMPD